jgi:hypothetical protein
MKYDYTIEYISNEKLIYRLLRYDYTPKHGVPHITSDQANDLVVKNEKIHDMLLVALDENPDLGMYRKKDSLRLKNVVAIMPERVKRTDIEIVEEFYMKEEIVIDKGYKAEQHMAYDMLQRLIQRKYSNKATDSLKEKAGFYISVINEMNMCTKEDLHSLVEAFAYMERKSGWVSDLVNHMDREDADEIFGM